MTAALEAERILREHVASVLAAQEQTRSRLAEEAEINLIEVRQYMAENREALRQLNEALR